MMLSNILLIVLMSLLCITILGMTLVSLVHPATVRKATQPGTAEDAL